LGENIKLPIPRVSLNRGNATFEKLLERKSMSLRLKRGMTSDSKCIIGIDEMAGKSTRARRAKILSKVFNQYPEASFE
jgi:hypothetical protein